MYWEDEDMKSKNVMVGAAALCLLLSGCGPTSQVHTWPPEASEVAETASPEPSAAPTREVYLDPSPMPTQEPEDDYEPLRLIRMHDVDVLAELRGTPRTELWERFGQPDRAYNIEANEYDEWMFLDTDYLVYMDIYYFKSEVCDVRIYGTNGLCTGNTRVESESGGSWVAGIEKQYWDDVKAEHFAAQSVMMSEDEILERFRSAGMTRAAIRDLLASELLGHWRNPDESYGGDVFSVHNLDYDEHRFLLVEYDSSGHVPVKIMKLESTGNPEEAPNLEKFVRLPYVEFPATDWGDFLVIGDCELPGLDNFIADEHRAVRNVRGHSREDLIAAWGEPELSGPDTWSVGADSYRIPGTIQAKYDDAGLVSSVGYLSPGAKIEPHE